MYEVHYSLPMVRFGKPQWPALFQQGEKSGVFISILSPFARFVLTFDLNVFSNYHGPLVFVISISLS